MLRRALNWENLSLNPLWCCFEPWGHFGAVTAECWRLVSRHEKVYQGVKLVKWVVWSIAGLYGVYMDPKAGLWRIATKNRSRHWHCGPGDVCCVSAGLNIRQMFGCGRRLGYRRRIGYLNNWQNGLKVDYRLPGDRWGRETEKPKEKTLCIASCIRSSVWTVQQSRCCAIYKNISLPLLPFHCMFQDLRTRRTRSACSPSHTRHRSVSPSNPWPISPNRPPPRLPPLPTSHSWCRRPPRCSRDSSTTRRRSH